jgi:hypothetical protein
MYKLIQGNQNQFEELLNEVAVEEIVAFCCSNDATKFAALVKIDEAYLEKQAKAETAAIKAEQVAKVKADKAAIAAKKAALKKELEAMDEVAED